VSSYEKVVCERLPLERFLYERSPLDKVALKRSGIGVLAAKDLAAPLMEITGTNCPGSGSQVCASTRLSPATEQIRDTDMAVEPEQAVLAGPA